MRLLLLLGVAACSHHTVVVPPVISSTAKPVKVARAPAVVRPVPTSGVAQIVLGDDAGCARRVDGTVWCWGDGKLGDGSEGQHVTPVQVSGLFDIETIFAGDNYFCGIGREHDVQCWGGLMWFDDQSASTGSPTPRPILNLQGAASVASSGTSEGCVHLKDGNRKCWGHGAGGLATVDGQPTTLAALRGDLAKATQIAVADETGCAAFPDGTVKCWGSNEFGQVGNGTIGPDKKTPAMVVGVTNATQVVVGRNYACALISDGTVSCWGKDEDGQLGDGLKTNRGRARRVPGLKDVLELTAGGEHVLALHRDLTVSCWGYNGIGQCGNATSDTPAPPGRVPGLSHVIGLAASFKNSCAVRDDGTAWCWGDGRGGSNGDGSQAAREVPTALRWEPRHPIDRGLPPNVRVTSLALDVHQSCATLSDGTVRCWGDGAQPHTGDAIDDDYAVVPTAVPGVTQATSVVLGAETTIRFGDGHIVMWDHYTLAPKAEPPVDALAGSSSLTCTLRRGVVTCTDVTETYSATLPNVKSVVVGGAHACVLLATHGVACFGENDHGQVGTADKKFADHFVVVPGLVDAVQVIATNTSTCVRRKGGEVSCWGDGARTGGHVTTDTATPVDVPEAKGAVELYGGYAAACARFTKGGVSCWGDYNQGYDAERQKVANVPWLEGATIIENSVLHSCAVFTDGHVACWGSNREGELGDQMLTDAATPVRVRW